MLKQCHGVEEFKFLRRW